MGMTVRMQATDAAIYVENGKADDAAVMSFGSAHMGTLFRERIFGRGLDGIYRQQGNDNIVVYRFIPLRSWDRYSEKRKEKIFADAVEWANTIGKKGES